MRFSELEGARVGVWGAGREIRSFSDQLARRLPRARIVAAVFDGPPPADVLVALHAPRARLAASADAASALAGCELLVRSPGVSIHRPELSELRAQGLHTTTATSLWLAEREGENVIGVTGTKGKSTTAALTAHLLAAGPRPVSLAGNIGAPALDLLAEPSETLAVVELSSYQIADLEVGPAVAVFTNLYSEHSDWHGSPEAYRAEKLRLLGLPGVERAVLNARDPALMAAAVDVPVTLYGCDLGWDVSAGDLMREGRRVLAAAELPLRGEHNALNLCAALAGAEASGSPPPELPGSLAGFQALPHRLTPILERDGVCWVNDSISTTPESTIAALASFPGRHLVLIAGGQDRAQDFTDLARELAARRATLIAVPSNGPRLLAAALAAGLPSERALAVADLAGAVALAGELAGEDAVVLLSPAAPSFDSYRDFEQRGELFAELVLAAGGPRRSPSR